MKWRILVQGMKSTQTMNKTQALEEALEILSVLRLTGVVNLYDKDNLLKCMGHINKMLEDLKENENV